MALTGGSPGAGTTGSIPHPSQPQSGLHNAGTSTLSAAGKNNLFFHTLELQYLQIF